MSEAPMTLLGRTEVKGKTYPLFIERLLLLLVVLLTVTFGGNIADQLTISWLGIIVGYVAFPMMLLAFSEMIGRFIQSRQ